MEITNNTETNSTLPDLVCNRTYNSKSPKEQQCTKTPTERLLDAFGSPIPSELDEEVNIENLQGYHTTEDEDDAIDGLLTLSNLTPKTGTKEKDNKSSKSSSQFKHKTKGAARLRKAKSTKLRKAKGPVRKPAK